jgi:simple sugar transport system ATP-binding protein
MARELAGAPAVIVASQPTRGVDVGAIADIHARLVAACEAGSAVLLFSAELEELKRLSHRILVLYRGRIVGEEAGGSVDIDRIGRLMLGGRDA